MKDLLIVSSDCRIFTLCNPGEEAAAIQKAIISNNEEIETYKSHLIIWPDRSEYWQQMLNEHINRTFSVMTWDEFYRFKRNHYLTGEVTEISLDDYDNALCILPPLKWCQRDGVEEFLMSEFYTDSFTTQYAIKNGKYYKAMVDAMDERTWLHVLLG